jgi:hypothetical protein
MPRLRVSGLSLFGYRWDDPRSSILDPRSSILEDTNKPLRDWFRVIHLMLTSKKGMSALQNSPHDGFRIV